MGVQAWAGMILRTMEGHRLVTRAPGRDYRIGDRHAEAQGVEKRYVSGGLKKPQPSHAWWITEAGTGYLRQLDEAADAVLARAAEQEARAAKQASALRAIQEMALQCGPHVSRAQRRVLAAKLRDAGCTLGQIGTLFGKSREMIRLDLLPPGTPRAPRTPGQPRLSRAALIRAAVAEEIAKAIERAVCEPGDQCADRFCPDCVKYRQAQADAATARRIGGAA